MTGPAWETIHDGAVSWRTKLIGEISGAFVMPRYVELFEQYFRGSGTCSFLEIGSGNGEIAERIREKKFDFVSRYLVSENFDQGVQWLRQKGLEAERVDAQKIPFPDASFDAVLSFDVMHHVSDPALMGREMMRTARGRLFLTESNGLSLGRKLLEFTPGHRKAGERSYMPSEYRSFFEHSGFKILRFEIHPFIFPLRLPAFWMDWTVRFNRWIERVPVLKWQCSNVYIYVEYERQEKAVELEWGGTDPEKAALTRQWHSIYASDALSQRRQRTHLQKLRKIGFLDLPETTKILDVACGEGEMLDLMHDAGFSDLTGLDPFEPSRKQIVPWRFVRGSAGKLPFRGNDFDVILCAHTLHHLSGMEEIHRFLVEAERVLRPGGRLFIIDHYGSSQLSIARFLLMSPLAKLGSWTSQFHDQLCAERRELDAYVKHYSEARRAILETPFSEKKWRQDLFFFYFEGRKRP